MVHVKNPFEFLVSPYRSSTSSPSPDRDGFSIYHLQNGFLEVKISSHHRLSKLSTIYLVWNILVKTFIFYSSDVLVLVSGNLNQKKKIAAEQTPCF